jgi:putative ABC transport system permease protein
MGPAQLLEVFQLGLQNLLRNKLRSLLTMLGMIFGVGSVVAMLSVGAGARHEILLRIQELGIENIIVNSVRPPPESKSQGDSESYVDRYGLTFRDQEVITQSVPMLETIMPVNLVRQRVWRGSRRVDASVLGVLPRHLSTFGLEVDRGRPLTAVDENTAAKVCVVRRSLVRELQTLEDPVGMQVTIGAWPFVIVGVLEDEQFRSHTRKALALDDRAQEIYIPYSTSMRTFGTLTYVERGGSADRSIVDLDQLIVVADSPDLVFTTARIVAAILGRFHTRKDYEIVVPLELLEQSARAQAVFSVVMVLIAGISLVVGGIGIANIMLATITERTREIGVRRALGARRLDILLQFLMETAAIGVVGGLFGCILGLAAIRGIVTWTDWEALVAPRYFVVSLSISLVVAILSGLYPARRASLMDPIAALRNE